ncbi:MAG: SemiSWEET family transporter [Patescibacteria group bacterium]
MNLLSTVAFAVSLSLTFIGLPLQLRKIRTKRSTEGLSFTYMLLVFLGFSTWFLHGLARADAYLAASQAPGIVLSLIILAHFWVYKKRVP